MRNKSRVIKILAILVLAGLLILGGLWGFFKYKDYKARYLTANEWFINETGYMRGMEELCEQMDTTVSMYINKNLDEEAYLSQMQVINGELQVFFADRKEAREYYNIDVDTYDYVNKAGVESAEKTYDIMKRLVSDCITYSSDRDKLSYLYLAYMEELKDELAYYSVCYDEVAKNIYEERKSTEEK